MTTPNDDPPEGRYIHVSVRMERTLHARLAALAESKHRSVRAQIVAMIERDLGQRDASKETPSQ